MSRKDDVKLLFNFMIELLKEEKEESKQEVKTEVKEETKQILTEKQDDSAKHILEVMKRAELMDKMRSTAIARPKLIPTNLRDEDEIAQADAEAINTYKVEKKTKNLNEFRNILTNAKDFMDELETKKPLVPSVPPSVLNEQEKVKEDYLKKRKALDNIEKTNEIKSKK